MKKSLLLCTVSGVLLCSYSSLSYAHDAATTLPTAVNSSSPQSRPANPASTIATTTELSNPTSPSPTVPPPTVTPKSKTPAKPAVLTKQTSESSTSKQENSSASKPDENATIDMLSSSGESLQFTRADIEPTATETRGKSRRRQGTEKSSSTTPLNKENLPNFAVSAPSIPAKPAPQTPSMKIQSEPVKPISTQPLSSKPVQMEDLHSAIEVENGDTVTQHNVKVYDKFVTVDAQGKNSIIKIIGGTVSSEFIALSASKGGIVNGTDITVTASSVGLLGTDGGTINLKNSTVNVAGGSQTHGIVFRNTLSTPMHNIAMNRNARNAEERSNFASLKAVPNNVVLTDTKLFVERGVGIGVYGGSANAEVVLKDSEIHADLLLKNEEVLSHNLTLTTEHSLLEGRVRTLGENRTALDLKNNTKWFLKTNKNVANNDKDLSDNARLGVDEKSYSNLSALSLTDSIVVFEKPTEGHYQTLFVGSKPQQRVEDSNAYVTYSATGTAEIHLNTKWSSHSPVKKQETDRVVIDGDVSGNTVVHINLLEKDQKITDNSSGWGEHMASRPSETHGISIIQVSGKANENSFNLAGKYMTMGGLPYKYVLTAYAPGTSHASQNLFGKNDKNFWDFRLQNAYVDRNKKIRALLPQVANYLVMPNALLSAGFSDVNNQNVLLDNMSATVFGTQSNKKKGIFFSSYGEKATLFSNRDPLHYGYGADVNYTALQLGVILASLENKDISTHFGLLGTYGKLAFTPKDMEDAEKTTLDKWSLTAYSGIQHSSGLYVNTLLSYGQLKGDITTALIGDVAKLDGTETLSVSATIGQKVVTSSKGLMFEPQAQLIYQNLLFNVFSDANNLEVDMGNPHQWLMRIGGRLTQTFTTTEENNVVSFYGKLNVLKTFGDGGTIKIGDTFYLDPTGSSIEGGIGVNAYLSQNIALHGDISYQKKLQRAGISGTNFSGGIRYHF